MCAWGGGGGMGNAMPQLRRSEDHMLESVLSFSAMWTLGMSGLATSTFNPEPPQQSLNYSISYN